MRRLLVKLPNAYLTREDMECMKPKAWLSNMVVLPLVAVLSSYVFILDFYSVGFDQVFVLTYITMQVIDVAARFMIEDDEERSGVRSRFLFSPAFVVRNYLII